MLCSCWSIQRALSTKQREGGLWWDQAAVPVGSRDPQTRGCLGWMRVARQGLAGRSF